MAPVFIRGVLIWICCFGRMKSAFLPFVQEYRYGWFGGKGSIVSYIPRPARGRSHPPVNPWSTFDDLD